MGPLLVPAVNEILADDTLSPLGPAKTRLVYLTDMRVVSENMMEIVLWDLVGTEGFQATIPLRVRWEEAQELVPPCVGVLWPGRAVPLRLDPLLIGRELAESDRQRKTLEVLFLNRDRDKRQVEYLSYTTGRTERDERMVPAMIRLLSLVTGRTITAEELSALEAQSLVETPSTEVLWELPSALQPESPRQLGDYELLAEIGRGGMGVVYLARQLSLGRIVALKVLLDDRWRDEVALARFQREMRALARCDHPNIIKLLTSGALPDGRLYYTMEYVPGADLEQIWNELTGQSGQEVAAHLGNSAFMRAILSASGKRRQDTESRYRLGASLWSNGSSRQATPAASGAETDASVAEIPVPRLPLPPLPELPSVADDPGGYVRHVVMLMRDAALALQTVHDQQIIHRDVKPANLMLTPDGARVVLMDFGLAKGPDPTLAASRQHGLLGTMRYAAPEQLAAANLKVGPAADVRALGVTMWELLTCRRLFAEAQDEKQLAMMIHEMDVPLLRAIDPSLTVTSKPSLPAPPNGALPTVFPRLVSWQNICNSTLTASRCQSAPPQKPNDYAAGCGDTKAQWPPQASRLSCSAPWQQECGIGMHIPVSRCNTMLPSPSVGECPKAFAVSLGTNKSRDKRHFASHVAVGMDQ